MKITRKIKNFLSFVVLLALFFGSALQVKASTVPENVVVDRISEDTGVSDSDFITSDQWLVFQGHAQTGGTAWTKIIAPDKSVVEGSIREIELDGSNKWFLNLSDEDGGFDIKFSDDGVYSLHIQENENDDISKSLVVKEFTIDTLAPTVEPKITNVASDNFIDSSEEAETHIIGQITDANYARRLSLMDQMENKVSVDISPADIGVDGEFDVVLNTSTLADGVIMITYTSADTAGNSTEVYLEMPSVRKGDNTAPEITSLELNEQVTGNITFDPRVGEDLEIVISSNEPAKYKVYICEVTDTICDSSTKIKGFYSTSSFKTSISRTWSGIVDSVILPGQYTIQITATDEALNESTVRLADRIITIPEENDNHNPVFNMDFYPTFYLGNGTESGDLVSYLSANDEDGDNLTFSISGEDAGLFEIIENNGLFAVHFKNTPEEEGDFTIIVTVDDGNGGVVSEDMNIAVEDVMITGIVWRDVDENGLFNINVENDEVEIEGVRVELLDMEGNHVKNPQNPTEDYIVNTDSAGMYEFNKLKADQYYKVKINLPYNDTSFTERDIESETLFNSNVDENGFSDTVNLLEMSMAHIDAGIIYEEKAASEVVSVRLIEKDSEEESFEIGDPMYVRVRFNGVVNVEGVPKVKVDIGGKDVYFDYVRRNLEIEGENGNENVFSGLLFKHIVELGELDEDGVFISSNEIINTDGEIFWDDYGQKKVVNKSFVADLEPNPKTKVYGFSNPIIHKWFQDTDLSDEEGALLMAFSVEPEKESLKLETVTVNIELENAHIQNTKWEIFSVEENEQIASGTFVPGEPANISTVLKKVEEGAYIVSLRADTRRILLGDGSKITTTIADTEGSVTFGSGVDVSEFMSQDMVGVLKEESKAPVITTSDNIAFRDNGVARMVQNMEGTTDAEEIQFYVLEERIESIDKTPAADSSLFFVRNDGMLMFKERPDFENPQDENRDNVYEVTVVAYDGRLDVKDISVTVSGNTSPEITGETNKTFNEGVKNLFTVEASDVDEGDILTFSLDDEFLDSAKFEINSQTGALSFKDIPDFENPYDQDANNTYYVKVKAVDDGVPSKTAEKSYIVHIENVNEKPIFTVENDNFEVNENEKNISTITASDPENDEIVFSLPEYVVDENPDDDITPIQIQTKDGHLFEINSQTGELKFKTAPDFENPADNNKDNVFEVVVAIGNENGMTSFKEFTITVLNISDSTPVITTDNSETIKVYENTVVTVLDVEATDADGDEIIFSLPEYIVDENPDDDITPIQIQAKDGHLFEINSQTGELKFKTAPDFENPADANTDNTYSVTVAVKDDTSDRIYFKMFRIEVLNIISDVAPEFIPNRSGQWFRIPLFESETYPENMKWEIPIKPRDPESNLIFAINTQYPTGGVDYNLFEIDENTGVLRIKEVPNYEDPAYENPRRYVRVEVYDKNNTALNDSMLVFVDVLDSNETAPTFITDSRTIMVAENTTEVGIIEARDIADDDDFIFTIKEGELSGDKFEINSQTGELKFKIAPDFENPQGNADNRELYQVNIEIKETETQERYSNWLTFNIKVTDVDENRRGSGGGGSRRDTDHDGVKDWRERNTDTDGDGIYDHRESLLEDADDDGVNDQYDAENKNPNNDSDNDGFSNIIEKEAGTNPLNPDSHPSSMEQKGGDLFHDAQQKDIVKKKLEKQIKILELKIRVLILKKKIQQLLEQVERVKMR